MLMRQIRTNFCVSYFVSFFLSFSLSSSLDPLSISEAKTGPEMKKIQDLYSLQKEQFFQVLAKDAASETDRKTTF